MGAWGGFGRRMCASGYTFFGISCMIGISVREEREKMMNENNYFLTLSTPLPEDIQKLKWCGQFEQAKRVIGLRLKRELPRAMKDRLTLELEILERLPGQYPYSWGKPWRF